jgi:perosamine synthetase
MIENPSKYRGNEMNYIERVLNSEQWSATGGNWNNALEAAFCEKFGVKYAIAMNSGTATLHSALVACGVAPGDEVIIPALTVIMDATAVIHAGAIPVYADINPNTFNIEPTTLEQRITPRTKAIIAVVVIEDNAQCFLGKYRGKIAGTIGDMASFSFENSKHISCGEGGIVVTNNEQYAEKARKIGGHGYKHLKANEGRVRLRQDDFQRPDYKRFDTVGYN